MIVIALISLLAIGLIYAFYDLYSCWLFTTQNPLKCGMLDGTTISLRQYAYYYWTLHMDYTIIGTWRWIKHSIKKTLWRLGLRKEKRSHASQLAQLFLGTSLMLYLKQDSFNPEKQEATFYAKDFNVPNIYASSGYISLKDFQVKVDLANCKAIECELGGKTIDIHSALRLAGWLLAVNSHVVLHDYSSKACITDHKRPEIRLGSIYTISINSAALGATPWMHTGTDQNLSNLYNEAVANSFPKHNTADLKVLAPYSMPVNFMIQARAIVFSVISKYNINIDAQAFFLETVIHSVDHQIAGEIIDPMSMIGTEPRSQELCADVDGVFALFVEQLAALTTDSKLYSSKIDWHQEIYSRLAEINEPLAKKIDWCIAT